MIPKTELKVLLMILGIVLALWAWREREISRRALPEPSRVTIEELGKPGGAGNLHVIIGSHTALFNEALFIISDSKGGASPTLQTPIDYCLYPVIPASHPFHASLSAIVASFGTIEEIPPEDFPRPADLRMLVKTTRFSSVASIPVGVVPEGEIKGVIINEFSSLSTREEKLIKSSFPTLDPGNLLVLEEGRDLTPVWRIKLAMAVGILLALVGFISFLRDFFR